MSDTTITPEERAFMRSIAEYGEKHKKHLSSAHVARHKETLRLLTALEAAEAESARLRAERDWLANKLIDCPPGFTNCAVDCAECRIEAARRAVGGEG